MKKLLTVLIVLLVIAFAAAAAVTGMFYKKATPSLLVDVTKSGGDIKTSCSQLIAPEFTDEKELEVENGTLSSQFWTSKWCLDSNEKALKSIHYDLTGYDFKSYLKALKGFNFNGFRGVATMDKAQSEIDIICCGGKDTAEVVLYGFGKTKLAGKTLEVRIEEAVYKGNKGETVLPVVLKDYTASAADKLTISLDTLDPLNTYHIEICEADKTAAPAYENLNIPQRFTLSGDKAFKVNIPEDGDYCIDYIMKSCSTDSYFEIHCDGKEIGSAETYITKDSSSVEKILPLKKGEHTIQAVSEEPLPEFENVSVAPADTVNSVYMIKNKKASDAAQQEFSVVCAEEGDYNITSTELDGKINVNGNDCEISSMGAVTVKLNKGYNTVKYASDKTVEIKITKDTE